MVQSFREKNYVLLYTYITIQERITSAIAFIIYITFEKHEEHLLPYEYARARYRCDTTYLLYIVQNKNVRGRMLICL